MAVIIHFQTVVIFQFQNFKIFEFPVSFSAVSSDFSSDHYFGTVKVYPMESDRFFIRQDEFVPE
jgi:hypothetical protein